MPQSNGDLSKYRRSQATSLLMSGGIDSAVLLDQLLGLNRLVIPIYVESGHLWQECELRAVRHFLSTLNRPNLAELIVLGMPLGDLHPDHWSISGEGVPDRFSPDEAVFIPGRNPLLLVKPMLWCQAHGVEQLALGTLTSNPFDDATPSFFASFEEMLRLATGSLVKIIRPFEELSKREVLQLGRHLPLELTFSCLSPIDELHCGACNKCAERQLAFRTFSMKDRTTYSLPRITKERCELT